MDCEIAGPVAIRPFVMGKVCQENAGHKHNYDHVTTLFAGEADVFVRDSEKGGVLDIHELRLPNESGEYDCGMFHIKRLVLPQGETIEFNVVRHTAVVLAAGSLNMEWAYQQDGQEIRGQAEMDEWAIHLKPSVLMKFTAKTDCRVFIYELSGAQDSPRHTAESCLIQAERFHTIKGRVENTRYGCIYPHRDHNGIVVEIYRNGLANVAAYC